MRRSVAVAWHASFFTLAGALYFFFVLPRWFELTGVWTSSLGNPLRIVAGVLIGLCALPVVFTLLHTRKPEFGTPQLALSLRFWSIVLHVLAGVLVVGAATAEIWISLDSAGQWLFGIYGAAAAIAVLGALGFYLAYVAELPPPPPKPLKVKERPARRGRGKSVEDAEDVDEAESGEDAEPVADADADVDVDDAAEPESAEPTTTPETTTETASEAESASDDDDESDAEADDESDAKLRNRRPGDKSTTRRFRRRRGGVALDD
jgi:hypothetical protein